MGDQERAAQDVVHGRLAEQVAELSRRLDEARRDEADGVHQSRVACRRLRAALATFRPLLDRRVTDPIRDELRWLARSLADARDVEVIHERLRGLMADERRATVLGPVRRRLDRTFSGKAREARASAVATLDSARCRALLALLGQLVAGPPWTEDAGEAAPDLLRKRVRREWKRTRRRVRLAEAVGDADPSAHDLALHDVRKAAKRLRYACEAVEPEWGSDAKRLRKAATKVTRVLGERQDTVVARRELLVMAAAAVAAGERDFTWGRLHAREQARAAELDADFAKAWRKVSRRKRRAWLQS